LHKNRLPAKRKLSPYTLEQLLKEKMLKSQDRGGAEEVVTKAKEAEEDTFRTTMQTVPINVKATQALLKGGLEVKTKILVKTGNGLEVQKFPLDKGKTGVRAEMAKTRKNAVFVSSSRTLKGEVLVTETKSSQSNL
jgi:hypothetical protein